MAVRTDRFRRILHAIQALVFVMLLMLVVSTGLVASGASAGRFMGTAPRVAHVPALVGTPAETATQTATSVRTNTTTPTITNTPVPCAPLWSTAPNPLTGVSHQLRDIDALAANDVWAVGYYWDVNNIARTLVEHWDGISWSVLPSPNIGQFDHNHLNAVAAVSANDVWAVGYYSYGGALTLIVHWDGTSWAVVPSPNQLGFIANYLLAVSAVSADDVWAVGYYRSTNCSDPCTLTMHWDGTVWSVVPSPNLGTGDNFIYDVTALSANDVWAVGSGSGALTMHWDGTSWSVVPNPGLGELYGVTAISANDVWAVGEYFDSSYKSLVEHWDGSSWSIVPSPNVGTQHNKLLGVAAVSANDIWAVGYSRNRISPYLTLIEHWDGASWSVVSSPNPGTNRNELVRVAVVSANNVWAAGSYYSDNNSPTQSLVEHYATLCGTPTNTPSNTPLPTHTPTRTSTPTNTATPTITNTPRPCDFRWSVVSSPNVGTTPGLNAVAVVSANDIWAVGTNGSRPLIEHWNGTSWSVVQGPTLGGISSLYGVAAVSANDVWAVGYHLSTEFVAEALIEHWDGTSWSVVPSPSLGTIDNSLQAVAAASANDVWAVGYFRDKEENSLYQTLVVHWDGTVWSVVPSPNLETAERLLSGVAVASQNDVWAVGFKWDGGGQTRTLIEHWDGTSWSIVPSPNVGDEGTNWLRWVTVVSASDVWAVGNYYADTSSSSTGNSTSRTLVEHWDGTAWSIVPSPNVGVNANYLYGVTAVSANDVWAVGFIANNSIHQTLVEHWDGTSWSVVPSPNVGGGANNNRLFGVAAVSANNVWAVGNSGNSGVGQTLVEHYTSPCLTPSITPTVTPTNGLMNTPTSTPEPAAIINGHLTWQNITQPNPNNSLVTGTLTLCNATAPVTYTFATDSTGNFTVTTGLPDGTYHWYMKGGRHLSTSSPTDGAHLSINDAHATHEFGIQRAGDTNSDNIVTAMDFNQLKNDFGLGGARAADFDYSGVVTGSDFNLLKVSFGMAGHTLICP